MYKHYRFAVLLCLILIGYGLCFSSSLKGEDDVSTIQKKAEEGDVSSAVKMGIAYVYGTGGLPIDYKRAFEYWSKGGKCNNEGAALKVAQCLTWGVGTAANREKASEINAPAMPHIKQ